ncbi:MAG: hypothetical protein KJO77_05300 [Bacteroidia bacterium]|nr:hypothetical protein [Bacteroidia bacterium]
MTKNKDLNYALIIFALTITLLFAFVELFPSESLAEADIEPMENAKIENVNLTSN